MQFPMSKHVIDRSGHFHKIFHYWKYIPTFLRDFIFTFLTSSTIIICSIATTRLLAGILGPEQFGAYSLARRIVALVTPMTTAGFAVAIPYYIPKAHSASEQRQIFLSSVIVLLTILPISLGAAAINSQYVTELVFGSTSYEGLFNATLLMIGGCSVYTILYSYYRGKLEATSSNYWDLSVVAVGPLIIAYGTSYRQADTILMLMAALMWCAIIPTASFVWKAYNEVTSWTHLYDNAIKLARYGGPRVPAYFFLTGLWVTGPLVAAHFSSLSEAGYLAASQSFLTALQGGVAAFGIVILPRMSKIATQNNEHTIAKIIENVTGFVIHIGMFLTILCLIWADEITQIILGPEYVDATPFMRVVLLSFVPYLMYVMLRSIIDGLYEKAINTRNLAIAFLINLFLCIVTVLLGSRTLGIAISLMISLFFLGFSTISFLFREKKLTWEMIKFPRFFFYNSSLGVAAILLKIILSQASIGVSPGIVVFGQVLVITCLYFVILWQSEANWVLELKLQFHKITK